MAVKDLYRTAMEGIGQKIAIQEIRKVIRGKDPEKTKLEKIISIVHSYEEDAEEAELAAERRAIEADEAEMRRRHIDDMFEGMSGGLEALNIRETSRKDGKDES